MTITNFDDGLLTRTERRNYIITPKNPKSFRKTVKNRVKASYAASE